MHFPVREGEVCISIPLYNKYSTYTLHVDGSIRQMQLRSDKGVIGAGYWGSREGGEVRRARGVGLQKAQSRGEGQEGAWVGGGGGSGGKVRRGERVGFWNGGQRTRSGERVFRRGGWACTRRGLGISQSGGKEAAFVLGLVGEVNSLDEVHIQHPPLQEPDSF